MTLVVARVTPLGVRLVGDMRVTYLGPERDQEARRAGYLDAALKLIVVRPTLCIGYAGDHVHALDAIKLIANSKLDVAHAERILTESHLRHRESDRWVDFLVASLRPSRLVAVKGGAATEDAASWIGDREAFADYQRHFLAGRPGTQPPAAPAHHRTDRSATPVRCSSAHARCVPYGPFRST